LRIHEDDESDDDDDGDDDDVAVDFLVKIPSSSS
jgi:hypothetical protein